MLLNIATLILFLEISSARKIPPFRGSPTKRSQNEQRPPPFGAVNVTSDDADLPIFQWDSSGRNLDVFFPDINRRDKILLKTHELMTRTDDNCAVFLGRLRNDEDSNAAVTLCDDEDERAFQISLLSKNVGGQFHVNGAGETSKVASPWPEKALLRNDEDPEAEWFMVESDSIVNPEELLTVAEMNDYCSSNGCKDVPKAHKLRVRIGYDSSFAEKEKDPEKWIKAVMTHTQAHLLHKSLPTQIQLEIVGKPKAFLADRWRAETSIANVRKYAKYDKDADLHVFFCADSKSAGTVGIAYVGALCETNGFQVSINERRETHAASGKVVAHEIGHNMGMKHDFAPVHKHKGCNGIMDYGDSKDYWSQCSQSDFINEYQVKKKRFGGKHCLQIIDYDDGLIDMIEEEEEEVEDNSGPNDESAAFCPSPNWHGDGFCDDENNTEQCGFDGGDCCDVNKDRNGAQWDKFCTDCKCREKGPEVGWKCKAPNWQGDGYCDDENNVRECGFDLGDCCSGHQTKNINPDWDLFCDNCQCVE